jgi:hypothetical protein
MGVTPGDLVTLSGGWWVDEEVLIKKVRLD